MLVTLPGMFTPVILSFLLKALASIPVTPLGIITLVLEPLYQVNTVPFIVKPSAVVVAVAAAAEAAGAVVAAD